MVLPEHTTYWSIPELLDDSRDLVVARIDDPGEVWYSAGPITAAGEPDELVGAMSVNHEHGEGITFVGLDTHRREDVYACRAAAAIMHCAVVVGGLSPNAPIIVPDYLVPRSLSPPVWRSLFGLTFDARLMTADLMTRAGELEQRIARIYPQMKEMQQV